MTATERFSDLPQDVPFRLEAVGGEAARSYVRAAVRAGRLRHLLHGVYAANDLALTTRGRAAAVALVLPDGAAVSRRTAAWLHGVDARLPGEHLAPVRLECTVPDSRDPVRRPGLTCYASRLDPEDVHETWGIPCTTPRRTALDLLRWLPPHMGLGSADALAHLGLVSGAELRAETERWRGARGIAKARGLVDLIEPATESFGESWLRLRFFDAGFPRPRPQIELRSESGHVRFRLDLGWEDERLAAEYDGAAHHASPQQQRHDLLRRERIFAEHRWRVYGVTQADVLGTSLRLERAFGQLLCREPRLLRRRW